MLKVFRIAVLGISFHMLPLAALAQEGPLATGGECTGAGTVSYSVGLVSYIVETGTGGTITQGHQQPYEIFTMGVTDNQNVNLVLSVYPNPTIDQVILNIEDADLSNLRYDLYDVNGKLLDEQFIIDQKTQIQMGAFSSGTYFLHVLRNTSDIKTFKIIKK
jgi:hypothetical protein